MKNTKYIDYLEELRLIFQLTIPVDPNHPITQGLAFYDWRLEKEAAYKKAKGLSARDLISDKAVYEFLTKSK